MAIIHRPVAGQLFGTGWFIDVESTVPIDFGTWHWIASIQEVGTPVSVTAQWYELYAPGRIFSVFGFNWVSHLINAVSPDGLAVQGHPMTLFVQVRDNAGNPRDQASVDIVLDLAQGIEYVQYFAWNFPKATGPGGGHDPMLDTILAAVQHTYINQP